MIREKIYITSSDHFPTNFSDNDHPRCWSNILDTLDDPGPVDKTQGGGVDSSFHQ